MSVLGATPHDSSINVSVMKIPVSPPPPHHLGKVWRKIKEVNSHGILLKTMSRYLIRNCFKTKRRGGLGRRGVC